jgi:hypothetical protein
MNVTVELIEELLDTMMLESDIPYDDNELINYEAAKKIIVSGTIEQISTMLTNPNMTGEQKAVSIITSISYLSMENFVLRVKKG